MGGLNETINSDINQIRTSQKYLNGLDECKDIHPMRSELPIGIFDSGIGGLSIASAIHNLMPNEQILYFGDTKNMPYGDKAKHDIERMSLNIVDFLVSMNCKMIVVACNSATVSALKAIKTRLPSNIILVDVVSPTLMHLKQQYYDKRIGIIATRKTVLSNVYKKRLDNLNQGLDVVSMSTPLLAPLIEHVQSEEIIRIVLKEYLSSKRFANIDAILLGCTHYPFIKNHIKAIYDDDVDVIDTSCVVAKFVRDCLNAHGITKKVKSECQIFFSSKLTKTFKKFVNNLFKYSENLINLKTL